MMPTGYTAAIKDGISFEQFVTRCARAMGALIMMRDEPIDAPIPERFEPSAYHAKKMVEAEKELAWLQKLPSTEAEREAKKHYTKALEQNNAGIQESIDLRNKYQAMLAQVVQWNSPTPDHDGLKTFMLEQLRDSIRFDCNEDYYKGAAPVRMTGDEWKQQKIGKLIRDIEYHESEHKKEVERTEARNIWIAALRDSIK